MTPRFPIRIACAAVLAASFGLTGSAFAASKTGNLNVKLTIESGCSVFSNNTDISLDFGTWTTLSQPIDGQASFDVACTDTKGYSVSLDKGLGAGVTVVDDRKLTSTSDSKNTIAYNLYTDTARTAVWGADSLTVAPNPTGKAGELSRVIIYGRVPKSATIPAAGVYTDTVKITLTSK